MPGNSSNSDGNEGTLRKRPRSGTASTGDDGGGDDGGGAGPRPSKRQARPGAVAAAGVPRTGLRKGGPPGGATWTRLGQLLSRRQAGRWVQRQKVTRSLA